MILLTDVIQYSKDLLLVESLQSPNPTTDVFAFVALCENYAKGNFVFS